MVFPINPLAPNISIRFAKNFSDKKLTFIKHNLYLFKKNPKLKSHFYDCIAYLDCLNQISTSEKTLKIVKKLLGEKTVLYSGSQVRMDHPNDPYYLPQHQELGQMSNRLVLFYVPLVNLDKKIGGINLRPKTHKLGFVRYNETAEVEYIKAN